MHNNVTMPSRRLVITTALRTLGVLGLSGAGGLITMLSGCNAQQNNAASSPDSPATSSTFAFDTYCTFTVYGDASAPATLAKDCAHYNSLFDLYDTHSDIARINAAQGAPTTVDPSTADIISQALSYCEKFNGLFDITIGTVSTLWNFDDHTRPTPEAIANALPHVNWRCVQIDTSNPAAPTVTLTDSAAKLDLGAIAKGYVADRLVEHINELSHENHDIAAAISLGGNIAYAGAKPTGEPWTTGIRDPNDPGGNTVVGTTITEGRSLVTSGLYERTFEENGVTYWHILDPHTGMPVETDVVSVTVCCPSSTTADALSTTLFVAGSKRGVDLVDTFEDTAAYFILSDGTTLESSRWQELTQFEAR